MSAAAHFLRRRSSSLLQYRHKLHSLSNPSLVLNVQSRNKLLATFPGRRGFSATTRIKPPVNAAESVSTSSSNALKLSTVGAAVLILSTGAWYATRDESQQVHQVDLPQVSHGRLHDERTLSQVEEKSGNLIRSSEVTEEVGELEAVNDTGEVKSGLHNLADEVQTLQKVEDSSVSNEMQSGEGHNEKMFSQPPFDTEQVPIISDHDSRLQKAQDEEIPLKDMDQKSPYPSEETEQDQALFSEESKQEDEMPVHSIVDSVKGQALVHKEYLIVQNDTVNKRDEARDVAGNDISRIREKLNEENPEMFYVDGDGDDRSEFHHEEEQHLREEPQLHEILERGNGEYVNSQIGPSELSASYLVQRGHEDSVRRYSEKEREGVVSDVLDIGEANREEKNSSKVINPTEDNSKLVGVDVLVGAIHTAEQLQAEADGRTYEEQLHKMQEEHKREIRDFQAKIFAYAEDTDQLEKELRKEKEAAALALMVQGQRAEERLQSELKHKEEEASNEKERLRLLGDAEAAASITREKAGRLEDIYAMQLQVDALRTAFYTHSEEARISHTAHKLAMGAFALEDAGDRGEPVEKEADLLISSAGGPGVDPLIDAVVSSLPSEALLVGISTRAQLHHKFTTLKGSLRELALMPPGGGGVFAHLFAKVAANLKISEDGSDGVGNEGMEMVIGKVERLLSQENLVDAAAVLEAGARGTAAEGLAVEWARQARNRAIIDQGLQVVRAHVVAVASGLS